MADIQGKYYQVPSDGDDPRLISKGRQLIKAGVAFIGGVCLAVLLSSGTMPIGATKPIDFVSVTSGSIRGGVLPRARAPLRPAAVVPKAGSKPGLGVSPLARDYVLSDGMPVAKRLLPRAAAEAEGITETKEGSLTKITLKSSTGATAEVFTFGATVTSFKAPSEVLFVRPDAKFDGSKPISGGLPFCWPQFGPGEIQQHGFARNCDWTVAKTEGGASPSVTFELTPSEYTKKMWNHDFKNLYTVTVDGNALKTKFEVANTGAEPFTFTGALHSYFSVGDIDQTAVQGGFKGATIFDRMLDPPARTTEDRDEVTVSKETDRCYEGVSGEVKIADKANSRTIVIGSSGGYKDTCVWNPYGNEGMGAKKFICVESGNVKDAVTVAPGATWVGEMSLGLE